MPLWATLTVRSKWGAVHKWRTFTAKRCEYQELERNQLQDKSTGLKSVRSHWNPKSLQTSILVTGKSQLLRSHDR